MTAPSLPQSPVTLPSKPSSKGAAGTGSQRDRRFTDTFFDNYIHPVRFPKGRPFTGQREYQSGSATESIAAGFLQSDLQCGEYFCDSPEHIGGTGQTEQERQMTLASVWVAPWLPPGGKTYMKFDYRRRRITFLYDAYIVYMRNELAKFWDACAIAAGQGEVVEPTKPDALSFRLRKVFGSPHTFLGQIRLAQACQAGDPWIMGAVETPNEELAKILGLDVQYLGAKQDFGDSQFVAVPKAPTPDALIKPEAVIGIDPAMVAQMIADALAQHDAAQKQAARDRMEKARNAKKPKAGATT